MAFSLSPTTHCTIVIHYHNCGINTAANNSHNLRNFCNLTRIFNSTHATCWWKPTLGNIFTLGTRNGSQFEMSYRWKLNITPFETCPDRDGICLAFLDWKYHYSRYNNGCIMPPIMLAICQSCLILNYILKKCKIIVDLKSRGPSRNSGAQAVWPTAPKRVSPWLVC